MDNSKNKSDEIMLFDVIIFFIKNRKLLLISCLIGILFAGGYYYLNTKLRSENQLENNNITGFVELGFPYHEPWDEIKNRWVIPRASLNKLINDLDFLNRTVILVYQSSDLYPKYEEDIHDIVNNIRTENKLQISFFFEKTKYDQVFHGKIRLDEFPLPVYLEFSDFANDLLSIIIKEANKIINDELKVAAEESINKDYIFYSGLDEIYRMIEVDIIKERIKLSRYYLEGRVSALGATYPLASSQSIEIIEINKFSDARMNLILIVLFFSFAPILIKYCIIGIKHIVREVRNHGEIC